MSAWVPFTVDEFRNDLPVDFLNQHAAWVLVNPSKTARMAEIVASTVNRFRSVASSSPRNAIDVDVTKIPAPGYDYAFAIAAYNLGLEMGAAGTGVVAGVSTVNVSIPVNTSGLSFQSNASSSSSATTPTAINFMDAMGRQVVRAEVWLRLVQSGELPIIGDAPFAVPSFHGRGRWPCGLSGYLRDDQRVFVSSDGEGVA